MNPFEEIILWTFNKKYFATILEYNIEQLSIEYYSKKPGFCLPPSEGVGDKILKCDGITKTRKHENMDGTTDIGDYVNNILDWN